MRLGVLDIGSNTVHLLLVDAHIGAKPEAFASHKRPLSLVKYLCLLYTSDAPTICSV